MSEDPELLNPVLLANMLFMEVTFSTFHAPIFWLNLVEFVVLFPLNIPAKVTVEDVVNLQLFILVDPELLNAVVL
jgi:hypothetical protein